MPLVVDLGKVNHFITKESQHIDVFRINRYIHTEMLSFSADRALPTRAERRGD